MSFIVFLLTLFPILDITDASIVSAQSATYENGSFWLPNLEVPSTNEKCDKCNHYYDPEEEHICTFKCDYCDGSFEQINNFYTNINLPIIYIGTNNPATVNVVMLKTQGEDAISEEIQTLFKGGLLNIKSMGIIYSNYTIVDFDSLAIWDLVQKTYANDYANNDKGWDGGQWGI